MNPKINIITWMYTHAPGDRPIYPQGGAVDEEWEQLFYWRCAFSLFASSELAHERSPLFRNILFVNKFPPLTIDGKHIPDVIKAARIEVEQMIITSEIPKDYYHSVTSQFYLVDILEQLVAMKNSGWLSPDDIYVVLDSDCLFNKPLSDEFISDVKEHGIITYTTGNSDEGEGTLYDVGAREMRTLAVEYAGFDPGTYYLAGGELFAIHGSRLEQFAEESRLALEISFERHKKGLPKYTTEEMLFGYVATKLKAPSYLGNKYIRRIYTTADYNTQEEADKDLLIWHLLNEKRRGFVAYFQTAYQQISTSDPVTEKKNT